MIGALRQVAEMSLSLPLTWLSFEGTQSCRVHVGEERCEWKPRIGGKSVSRSGLSIWRSCLLSPMAVRCPHLRVTASTPIRRDLRPASAVDVMRFCDVMAGAMPVSPGGTAAPAYRRGVHAAIRALGGAYSRQT